jgi:arylsulfatase A-like enzyme/Tfp pilus assembly protein PilF
MRRHGSTAILDGTRLLVLVMLLFTAAAPMAAAASRPNLLLISIDTLRADYLSCNGSTRVETPHLDALARGGVNFTRARAAVPLTLPSHASILTGAYPPTHSVRDNAAYRLPEASLTLAEVLQESGYRTAAFVASFVLDRRFGLAQGFEHYDDRTWSDISMLENLEAERSGEAVFNTFRLWLAEQGGVAPFFAWIHLYDPHAPYSPPEPFLSRYPRDPYAGEVAYTDHVVDLILDELRSRRPSERTLVAVVGDHGEGLGEHQESTHSLLIYNSTLHVPLLLHAPGLLPAGTSVDSLVRTIDLAPTLLDYLGEATQFGEGLSLRGLIERAGGSASQRPGLELMAYSESLYPRLHLGWSELRGLEVGRYRIILAPEPELYDLAQDPGETVNLAKSQRDLFRQLRQRLEELSTGFPGEEETADPGPLDPQTEARLRSLGYLGGSRAPTVTPSADPKHRMETWGRVQLALAQFDQRDYDDATATLEVILATEKDIPLLYNYLGSSYMRLEEWAKAERIYQGALSRGFESASLRVDLGLIYLQRGDSARAEREFTAALEIDELSVAAHYRLGDLHRAARRHRQAAEHYRRALAINSDYVYAWNGLGMALAAGGKDQDALEAFQKAVGLAPRGAEGFFNFAVQLERMGHAGQALTAYERFLAMSEQDPHLAAQRGRAAEALLRLRTPDN